MATKGFSRTYGRDNYETQASIKRHVSYLFGFKQKCITLLEGSYDSFIYADDRWHYCNWVAFSVNGIGYTTDFETLEMNSAYDCKHDMVA